MILFIKLLLAHLIGDFIVQPASWVKAKENKKLRAFQLYLHIIMHWILIMLLVWDWTFLKWAVILVFIHFIIDVLKLYLQNDKTKRFYFFADQSAHILSIILICFWYTDFIFFNSFSLKEADYLLVTMVVFIMFPSSILIKTIMEKWTPYTNDKEEESLQHAGKFIGILERLFVFMFVVLSHWEPIGFLLAAKSVFRFGDLKESKDRKLTEYILIGTLLSFGISVLAGIVYNRLLTK